MKYKFYIICEFREDDPAWASGQIAVSDRPRKQTILDFCDTVTNLGHFCTVFGGIDDLIHSYDIKAPMPKGIYVNFNDGLQGSYGRVQAPVLLDLLGLKYANSNPFVSALLNNKHFTKMAANKYGILTPKGFLIYKSDGLERIEEQIAELQYPVIIKPNTEGSSVGISNKSVCYTKNQVHTQLNNLRLEFDEIIIEEYIEGYEITTLIFGNSNEIYFCDSIAFMLNEKVLFDKEVMGANEKIKKTRKNLLAEKVLDPTIVNTAEKTSRQLIHSFGINDLARYDYRITADRQVYLLEINSLPRLGRDSDLGFLAAARGVSYEKLVEKYINTIIQRLKLR